MATVLPTTTSSSGFGALSGNFDSLDYYVGFDYVTFYVGCANLAASHFIRTYGFQPYCYKNLETGPNKFTTIVIRNGDVIIQFVSVLVSPKDKKRANEETRQVSSHLAIHGDSVKDVAFTVNDVDAIFNHAMKAGASVIQDPITLEDAHGSIRIAKIGGIGNTIHTLVDRSNYSSFFPEYVMYSSDSLEMKWKCTNPVYYSSIDHCVQNQDWSLMTPSADYYQAIFGFHQFWSVDDKQVYTQFSALKSTVMADSKEVIKMPINEPAKGLKQSQIEEFIHFNDGPGVQHIAISVVDIISTINNLRANGVDFIDVPETYYQNLKQRLHLEQHPHIQEDFQKIMDLGILVDFDEKGYLLQLFTRPVFDRPTFFFEFIQRHDHNGFGAGNFKGLFEVLEADQARRGNLIDQEEPPLSIQTPSSVLSELTDSLADVVPPSQPSAESKPDSKIKQFTKKLNISKKSVYKFGKGAGKSSGRDFANEEPAKDKPNEPDKPDKPDKLDEND